MQKLIHVDGIEQPIMLARRKGTRSLKLSIKNGGVVRVAIPFGIPETMAVAFVKQKRDWIQKHAKPTKLLHDGDRIGKSHSLHVHTSADTMSIRTRLKLNQATVTIPIGKPTTEPDVQAAMRRVAEKALSLEAEKLLPQRLEALASKHAMSYRSITTRKLKSRWGSCDSHQNITLSIYLMQHSWDLIDYVILHELAHTKHQHHQAAFWAELERMLPDWKALRTELKTKPTEVFPTNF